MARHEEPFVVFLFGMRLNSPRGLRRWLWGLRVLRRIEADLAAHPERGLLAGWVYRSGPSTGRWGVPVWEGLKGRTLLAVQYWESFEALDAWARDHSLPHRPEWQRYLREAAADPSLGLWHETYLVTPGTWEGVYMHMPPWGIGTAGEVADMRAKGSARERLRERRKRAARALPTDDPGGGGRPA